RAYGAGRQTYSEWTAGFTIKPAIPHTTLVALRPEIRWDKSLSGGHPFNGLKDNGSFTLATDIIVGF
ncbi:outer membrane beta-barrel protein, partial [Rhizosaccharibacter radicis]|nr:porin [Acetobacteraceae bacterium KSS12]MCQ8241209.1 porin [Acetobacteraceae bacterium KSS12]